MTPVPSGNHSAKFSLSLTSSLNLPFTSWCLCLSPILHVSLNLEVEAVGAACSFPFLYSSPSPRLLLPNFWISHYSTINYFLLQSSTGVLFFFPFPLCIPCLFPRKIWLQNLYNKKGPSLDFRGRQGREIKMAHEQSRWDKKNPKQ